MPIDKNEEREQLPEGDMSVSTQVESSDRNDINLKITYKNFQRIVLPCLRVDIRTWTRKWKRNYYFNMMD